MHPPFFHELTLKERKRKLERAARRAQPVAELSPRPTSQHGPVTLRLCRPADADVLRDLAALSGEPAPTGTFVLAEVERRIVAALPLAGGPALADPFLATAHIVLLLQLRADQINGARARWRPRRFRFSVLHWSRA